MKKLLGVAATTFFLSTPVAADVCDYRPSALIGGVGAGAVGTAGAGAAAAGIGAKTVGFYTLTHSVSGATMLGSTATGASAAGTVGIIGGSAGVAGTIGSILMAPATIIAGLVVGAGTAIYEGACYFSVERIEDPAALMPILENLDAQSESRHFELHKQSSTTGYILLATSFDEDGNILKRNRFDIENLYIEDGILRHRDWGPNTTIGHVGYVQKENTE